MKILIVHQDVVIHPSVQQKCEMYQAAMKILLIVLLHLQFVGTMSKRVTYSDIQKFGTACVRGFRSELNDWYVSKIGSKVDKVK